MWPDRDKYEGLAKLHGHTVEKLLRTLPRKEARVMLDLISRHPDTSKAGRTRPLSSALLKDE